MASAELRWPNWIGVVVEDLQAQRGFYRDAIGLSELGAGDDIHAARDALVARGVEAVTEIDGGEDAQGYWCYFRDAEGNIFELSQRLGSSWK